MGLPDRLTDAAAQEAIGQLQGYYAEMGATLEDRDYPGGEYPYADISFFMAQIFAAGLGAPMTGVTPRLLAWRERLMARPAVNQFVRQFADSLAQYQLRIPDFIERAAGRYAPRLYWATAIRAANHGADEKLRGPHLLPPLHAHVIHRARGMRRHMFRAVPI